MPAAFEQFKKLGSTTQIATLTLLPFLVLAFVAPEFCNCAASCASMRGYVLMAAAAWFYASQKIVAKLSPDATSPETAAEGKANACCDSPVAAPPPAPAAKAA